MPTTNPKAIFAERWLSQDFSQYQPPPNAQAFDLVIIGSGYGASMAAATFAGSTKADGSPVRVCILERGKEYLPGAFPSTVSELPGHVRWTRPGQSPAQGNREGVFDVRCGEHVNVMVGNGLGGGSLINAAVMLKPDFDTFESRLPPTLVRDLQQQYLDRAQQMLGASVRNLQGQWQPNDIRQHAWVQQHGDLPKTRALHHLAEHACQAEHTPITVQLGPTPSPSEGQAAQAINLPACTLCGDCCTGCNVGARASLDTNLLLRAARQGCAIFTSATVLNLQYDATQKHWQLAVAHTLPDIQARRSGPVQILAQRVIVAAGTLGSTELLLRSSKQTAPTGLSLSPRLGQQFSGNGDNVAAVRFTQPVGAISDDARPLQGPGGSVTQPAIGPEITGVLRMPADTQGPGFLIQEFSVPAPVKRFYEEWISAADAVENLTAPDWSRHGLPVHGVDPAAVHNHTVQSTLLVGLIGHDQAQGVLQFNPAPSAASTFQVNDSAPTDCESQLQVHWPHVGQDPLMRIAFEKLQHLARLRFSAQARVMANPFWRFLPDSLQHIFTADTGKILTVHPLGGCAIGERNAHNGFSGVVNEWGEVYEVTPEGQAPQWEGSLMVLDGAVLPGSLGANPALTIAAISLRASEHLRQAWGWSAPSETATLAPALQFAQRPRTRPLDACTNTSPKRDTELQIAEQLVGRLPPMPTAHAEQALVLEVSWGFAPVALPALLCRAHKRLHTDHGVHSSVPGTNTLRLFSAHDWDTLGIAHWDDQDPRRNSMALVYAQLQGHMDLLVQQPSSAWHRIWNAGMAYLRNRGLRDIADALRTAWATPTPQPSIANKHSLWQRLQQRWQRVWQPIYNGITLCTHAGEQRCFVYEATLHACQGRDPVLLAALREKSQLPLLRGKKTLTYAKGQNVWNQLLYLDLQQLGDLPLTTANTPLRLKLDARFLARQGLPLMRITRQHDGVHGLLDMVSFGTYMARLMLSIHVCNFRKPDPSSPQAPQRLPGEVPGLPLPNIVELDLESSGTAPVRVRLTRYRARNPSHRSGVRPLVLLHGYSASGTTFAHPALQPSMAQYFWERGHDIWIIDLRTSAGMPTAALPWTFEDVAWADIPVAFAHIAKTLTNEQAPGTAQPVQVDVFAHCIGAVMLSMALLTDTHNPLPSAPGDPTRYIEALRALPHMLGRVALSQKGFEIAYTDANFLRAYVLQFFRGNLRGEYHFCPNTTDRTNGLLLDRLLSSMPYPHHEWPLENPCLGVLPWAATRHRMDALYERTFNLYNMPASVLQRIDDFFGSLNLDTLSQVIDMARFNSIRTRDSHNRFVSIRRLRQQWPRGGTLLLHAKDNGMVSPVTNQRMSQSLTAAGIAHQTQLVEGGHQDCLMGNSAKALFQALDTFLQAPVIAPPAFPRAEQQLPLTLPWLGPRIHAHDDGHLSLMVGGHPRYMHEWAFIVPLRWQSGQPIVCEGAPALMGTRLVAHTGWIALDLWPYYHHAAQSYLVVTQADLSLIDPAAGMQPPPSLERNTPAAATPLRPWAPVLQHPQACVHRLWLAKGEAMQQACVPQHAIEGLLWPLERHTDTAIALASCQYPAGVFDSVPAHASYQRMLHWSTQQHARGVLLIGDQIYADATVGLNDSMRREDRYERSYEAWLQIPPLRALMREVALYTQLDDHEIQNDWEPQASAPTAPNTFTNSASFATRRDEGVRAFWQFQRGEPPQQNTPLWRSTTIANQPVFLLDTRTERGLRTWGEVPPSSPSQLISDTQLQALQTWLLHMHAQDPIHGPDSVSPKLIASPVWLLPRTLHGDTATQRLDDWGAYPQLLRELLAWIAQNGIRGVVFMCGDAHLAGLTRLQLMHTNTDSAQAVQVHLIQTPALYAPYPFVNHQPHDFHMREALVWRTASNALLRCDVDAELMPIGNGFVGLQLHRSVQARWSLHLLFEGDAGCIQRTILL